MGKNHQSFVTSNFHSGLRTPTCVVDWLYGTPVKQEEAKYITLHGHLLVCKEQYPQGCTYGISP